MGRNMNILFLYGSMGKGGAERVIASLSNLLVDMGDTVNIAVSGGDGSAYPLDKRVGFHCLSVARASKSAAQAGGNLLRKMRAIRDVVKTLSPDVVVAFEPQLAVLAKLACPKAKVIGSERSNPYLARTGLRKKLFVKLSWLADGFVFQTAGARGFYPKRTQKKSAIIPNGVFVRVPDMVDYAAREKAVCTTGSLRAVKRHDLLISAFAEMHRVCPEYALHIYGDGPLRATLQQQIETLGLADSVTLMGNTADVGAVLTRHRIFVLSSDHEGMPNGLIEAMACGCACVSTDCNFGPSELVQSGENGVLVPIGDAKQMADALVTIAQDNALGTKLANNAQAIARELSPEQIAKRFRTYFETVSKEP